MSTSWNLWHGCNKKSEGCKYCYVYRNDQRFGRDASAVKKNQNFYLPIKKNRKGEYIVRANDMIYTCFTSDFLLDVADEWRIEAWDMIRERRDCKFFFITKRIERFSVNLPEDWGDGWDNVIVGVTCENQKRADERLSILMKLPIKHKLIICEPLLEDIDLREYLDDDKVEEVCVGGESGKNARLCDYEWVLNIRKQCLDKNISFYFKQTGAYLRKDNKVYSIPRRYQHKQAKKANISFYVDDIKPVKEVL